MGIAGKVVVITGAAKGVGRYVARSFATADAHVVLADIAPLEITTNEVLALGAEALPVPTNVCDESSVADLMRRAHERFGRIDVLINSAGIVAHFHTGTPRWPRIRDMPREQFQRVIDTNLVGTFLCAKHAIPYMESLNAGHIINFGQGNLSPSNRPPNIGTCAYATSKISLRAFTKELAEEEREFHICVLSMGPGGTRSIPRVHGPGIPGGGGGIITDDSPEWSRNQGRPVMFVDELEDSYVIAAQAPMNFSGQQVTVRDGAIVAIED